MAPETARGQNAEQSQILAPSQGVKAALYARVSTDRQREEATIESQLVELKRQIAAAGHALVKEYIDVHTAHRYAPQAHGELLALKTDAFDAVLLVRYSRAAPTLTRFLNKDEEAI